MGGCMRRWADFACPTPKVYFLIPVIPRQPIILVRSPQSIQHGGIKLSGKREHKIEVIYVAQSGIPLDEFLRGGSINCFWAEIQLDRNSPSGRMTFWRLDGIMYTRSCPGKLDRVNWTVLSVRMQTLGIGWLFGRILTILPNARSFY